MTPTIVDNSTLKSVSCSTRALLRYKHGYTSREESAALRAGSAIHAGIASYLEPNGLCEGSTDLAMKVIAEGDGTEHSIAYETWASANVAPDDRLSWPNVSRIMRGWFDTHPLASFPFIVKHVEIGFSFPISDDVTLCGRMDGIVEMKADGSTYVLEHKTTGQLSPWWLSKFKLDSQLTLYTDGAQQHLNGAKVQGVILNTIDLKRMPASEKKCREHAVAYMECGPLHMKHEMSLVQRTPEALVEGRKTALNLARRWRDLNEKFPLLSDIPRVRTQGTFIDGFCGFCDFKDFCSAGRPMDLIDSMLIVDHWSPFDHSVSGKTSSR